MIHSIGDDEILIVDMDDIMSIPQTMSMVYTCCIVLYCIERIGIWIL